MQGAWIICQLFLGDDKVFHFENEKSVIYHKGILITKLVFILSIVLTQIFDDTYIEFLFSGLWILSISACGILEGMKTVIAKQNRVGYLYFIGIGIFLISIFYIYVSMN